MDTILCIPSRNITAVLFDTETTVVDLLQTLNNFFHGFLLHIFQSYYFSGFIGVTAKQEKMVDFFLSKRKSRGHEALCLVDKTDLFTFGEEQIQT